MPETYAETAQQIAAYLAQIGGDHFPDDYAALRHALFVTDTLLPEMTPPRLSRHLNLDVLTRLAVDEFSWGRALRHTPTLDPDFVAQLTHKERAALMRGIVRGGALVSGDFLLNQIGVSNTLDALVRDALAFRDADNLPKNFVATLRAHFAAAEERRLTRPMVVLLDIAAAHRWRILSDNEVGERLAHWSTHERLSLALLRYAAALELRGLLFTLHAQLEAAGDLSLARQLALLDALLHIGDPTSCAGLEQFADQVARSREPSQMVCQTIDAIIQALSASPNPQPAGNKLTIAQFMFLGRIGRAGKGNSGGLGVFLGALGDALAQTEGIAHVYTMVLLNAAQAEDDPSLLESRGPRHTVVHIPICCRHPITQYQMMTQDAAIRTAVTRMLHLFGIAPDIFHLRYSDHGSRAAAQVAQQMGKKIVLTLTTDPHRQLSAAFTRRRVKGLEAKSLTVSLTRVLMADQLVRLADGFIAMPTARGTMALKAYFPQLMLDPTVDERPLGVISEGIQVGDAAPLSESADPLLLLCQSESAMRGQRLDSGFGKQPILLSVGRLHPVKQQPALVQAWVESGLWEAYNLVLIGGNLDAPNSIERRMLADIKATLSRSPEAQGRFCLLPALPNAEVRQLERDLVRSVVADRPHVYVCSSVKEEFGIAILEAMDAGLLVFGPEEGGLSSYIASGVNGFLIDTSDPQRISRALKAVLTADAYDVETLQDIAAEGMRTVRERFNISATAQAFAAFYRDVAEQVRI